MPGWGLFKLALRLKSKKKKDKVKNLPGTPSLENGAPGPQLLSEPTSSAQLVEVSSPATSAWGVQVISEPTEQSGFECEVDIVAVHGLGGDPIRTWTHSNGNMWIRDFLPKQIPNARIMTYGYESSLKSRSQLGIRENAEGLFEGLKVKRYKVEKRPLIFIGHSLGGLVIKRALLRARDQNNPLLDETFGIMFMGVPHNGADIATFAGHLTAIVKLAFPLSRVNLKDLERDSRALAELSASFEAIQDRFSYISVFESDTTPIPGMLRGSVKIVPDASSRLGLGKLELARFSIIGSDHRNVCKFRDADDSQYELVWENLLLMVGNAIAKSRLPPEVTSAPAKEKRHFVVPFSRHKHFVGRNEIFNQLHEKLPHSNHEHKRAALWGLGGIGKTQIALEYVYRAWGLKDSQKSIFWVHAGNAVRFEQDYRTIAKLLNIPGHDDRKQDTKDLVKQWFQLETTGNWILIFDNADDLDVLFHSQKQSSEMTTDQVGRKLIEYIPNGPTGTLLFTTRDFRSAEKLAGSGCGIQVGKFDLNEGAEVFRREVQPDIYVYRDAQELLEALDYFPLAIAQATAYIRENGKTLSEYFALYHENNETQAELLSEEFEDLRRDPTVTNSVMMTWLISFEQIKRQSAVAVDLLYIMSALDRQGIPRDLVEAAKFGTKVTIDKALGLLTAFSFITPSKARKSYEMHKLVQLAIRARLGSRESMKYAAQALALVSINFPEHYNQYEQRRKCNRYAPHAAAILAQELPEESISDKCTLLAKYGIYSQHIVADYGEAERTYRLVLKEQERVLGSSHDETLASVNNIAWVLRDRGKYKEAEEMSRRFLKARESDLGPENPKTLVGVANLAFLLRDQGKYAEAEKMYLKVLEQRERDSGPEHPDTLAILGNLAMVLRKQGRYEEAEKISRRVLKVQERDLGLEHPYTLISVNDLGLVLQRRGKYEEAEKMIRRALEARERNLGSKFPSTLRSLSNLATLLQEQGKYEEAEKINRQVLAVREKVLGPEHPETLTSLNNLALVLQLRGKYEEAEKMDRQGLEVGQKNLGPEHPEIFQKLNNLAAVLMFQGKYEEAEQMNQRALEGREKILGPEHHDTLHSINNLGMVLHYQKKYREAEKMYRRALEAEEASLGPDHPSTLISVNNVAMALRDQEKYEEAEMMNRRALEGMKKVLGLEHPDTLGSISNLAYTLENLGRYEEGEKINREAMEVRMRVLGPEHPATLVSLANLASTLGFQGKYDEANSIFKQTYEALAKTLSDRNPYTVRCLEKWTTMKTKAGMA